jgi:hypothetical protein
MQNIKKCLRGLRRLNELEGPNPAIWVECLTPRERAVALAEARRGLPSQVLGHHERLVARRKRSLAVVRNGVCGACHIRLPLGHQHPSFRGGDLDVCDNCGVFLEWEEPTPVALVEPVVKSRRSQKRTLAA